MTFEVDVENILEGSRVVAGDHFEIYSHFKNHCFLRDDVIENIDKICECVSSRQYFCGEYILVLIEGMEGGVNLKFR